MISLTANAAYGYGGKQFIARITGRDSKFTFRREFIGRRSGKRNESTAADVDDPGLYEVCDIDKHGSKDSGFFIIARVGDDDLVKLRSDKEDAMAIAKALDAGRDFDSIIRITVADPDLKNQAAIHRRLSDAAVRHAHDDQDREITVGPEYQVGGVGASPTRRADVIAAWAAEVARLEPILAALRAEGRPERTTYEILTPAQASRAAAGHTLQSAVDTCWTVLQALPEKEAKKALTQLRAKLKPPVVAAADGRSGG